MRPFAHLAEFSAAVEVAESLAAGQRRSRLVRLQQAAGRVVARAAMASTDVPADDRAAMDGYAVRFADCTAGAILVRSGRLAAGQPCNVTVTPGTCIEIATGAQIPADASAVIPVEQTRADGDQISILEGVGNGVHISRQGNDLRAGTSIAEAGAVLNPALLSACAAGGVSEIEVFERPRVLLAPTGDEVVGLGRPLAPGQVYDSNACGLQALFEQAGAVVERADIVLDESDALVQLLERQEFDLTVTIGGTSVGRRDLVADAVARLGEVLIHGVAVRPGKPLLLGRVGTRPVVGLPGFPTTCMMLGYAVVEPLVRRLGGLPALRPTQTCALSSAIRSPAGKVHLLPVAVEQGLARPTFTFSSAISSMARASGWVQIPAEMTDLPSGTKVEVRLF